MATDLTIDPATGLEEVTVSAKRPTGFDNLDNFKRQDFLKSSQFVFRIYKLPFYDITNSKLQNFSLFCEAVEFPGKSINAIDYKIPGTNKLRIPYSKEFNEVTLTYIHNMEIPVYDIFSTWIDSITRNNNSTENAYFDEIVTDFNLFQYSEMPTGSFKKLGALSNILNSIDKLNTYLFDSSKLFNITDIGQTFVNRVNAVDNRQPNRTEYYNVRFYDAYPVSMASMPSTWADEGYHRLSITWAYRKFTINESTKENLLQEV